MPDRRLRESRIGNLQCPRIADFADESGGRRGFRRSQEHRIFFGSRASREITRRGAKRIASDRRSLSHTDAAVASGLVNSRTSGYERAKAPIIDQHLQHLPRRRIYIEGDAGRDRSIPDDFGGDGEIPPSGIGGGTYVGLGYFFALDFSDSDDLARARRLGDERF